MGNDIKLRLAKDGYFDVNDELAGIVPMAGPAEQEALANDIYTNGQREPIVLWKGKIVDGRCRQTALRTNNMNVMYKELDDELTEDEVKIFVKSVNTRRNLTITQKAMCAAEESIKPGSKAIHTVAKSWGISEGLLKNAKYILSNNKDIASALFDGKSVKIKNKKCEEVSSNKITAVYAYLKKIEENVLENTEEHSWTANSYIKTQVGKEWFYSELRRLQLKENVEAQKLIAELANYKFTKEKIKLN